MLAGSARPRAYQKESMHMTRWFIKMAAVLAVALSLGCGYNDFQRLDETTKSAWSRWSTSTSAAPT